MKYKEQRLEMLTIVGISVRTTNKEGKAQKDIGQLWSDFFVNKVKDSIPNKVSEDIYCVYSDYESDFMGEYTTYIGCAVKSADNLPRGLVVKEIPASKFYKFVAEGKLPDCVGETWNHIWNTDYNRNYIADFDVYEQEASDPNNAKVITYLSIK